jgi:hypothetical protein
VIVITAVCPGCGHEPENKICEICGYEGEKNGWALQTLYLPNTAYTGIAVGSVKPADTAPEQSPIKSADTQPRR